MSGKYLLIPPSLNYRIVSDQAIIVSACSLLHAQGFTVYLLSNKGLEDCHVPSYVRVIVPPRHRYVREVMHLLTLLRFRRIIWLATDVIDGTYKLRNVIKQAFIFRFLQHLSHIYCIGFSFRKNVDKCLAGHLSRLHKVHFSSRDKESKYNFEELTGLKAELCADIVYCLHARPVSKQLAAEITQLKNTHRFTVALNISTHYFHHNRPALEDMLKSIRALLSAGAAIIWIPMDFRNYRSNGSDVTLHAYLNSLLSAEEKKHMINVDYMLHPSELKTLLSTVDVVITGRMHLLIMALAEKIVPFALSYHDKFYSELASWNLKEQIIDDWNTLEPRIIDYIKNKNITVDDTIFQRKQQLAVAPFRHAMALAD